MKYDNLLFVLDTRVPSGRTKLPTVCDVMMAIAVSGVGNRIDTESVWIWVFLKMFSSPA
jgi:hypothetical protein